MTATLLPQQKASLTEYLRRTEPRLFYALAHHRNTGKKKMSFEGKRYLLPIYSDNSRDIVVQKSVQCGISEWEIIEAFSKCSQGLAVFFVLPKYDLRNSFVANRVDKCIEMVPFYRRMLKDAVGDSDSKNLKHFANGTIKFASSNTISDFSEFPADVVIIDELDRCDQQNIAYANDRIVASKHKYTRKVANPTIEGFGIADEFKNSDQKEWMARCDKCQTYQELDFFKNVVEEVSEKEYQLLDREWTKDCGRDIHTVCVNCSQPFDRLTEDAYWHRKNPASDVSGYHISRLMDAGTAVAELWKIFQSAQGNETKMQVFFNSDLGIPYQSKGSKLTDFLLDQCVDDYAMPSSGEDTIMGVDVGAVLNVTISKIEDGRRRKVHVGTVNQFEELDILVRVYGVSCCVMDALPETRKAKEFRDRFRGQVYLCQFHTNEGGTQEIKINQDEYMVTCDRTQVMDDAHADILTKNVILPRGAKTIDNGQFYEQMCAPTRIFDEKMGRFVWREGSKPDHYRLADTYEKIAMTIQRKMGVKAWTL